MLQRTMYKILLALLLAQQRAVLVGTVQAASETTSTYDGAKSPRGSVSTLSAAALKQALQQHKYLLVDFMAPWCGHCQQLAPEFLRAAEELGDMQSDLRLAEVDVTQHSSVQAEYGIAGFPTLKWFVNGKESRLTVEARSAEELVAFCTKNTEDGPVASTEKLKLYLAQYPFVAVAYLRGEEGEHFEALSEAETEMTHLQFVYIINATISEEMNAAVPSIVSYVRDASGTSQNVYDGEISGEAVTQAVRRHSSETLKILDDDNADEMLDDENAPKVVLFRSSGEVSSDFIAMKEAAEMLKHKFNFIVVKEETNAQLAEFVGLENASNPPRAWVYVFHVAKRIRYRFEQEEVTAAALATWLDAFSKGELAPYLMSEEPPPTEDVLVKTVVGRTFSAFVNQDKHVLIAFVAPWGDQSRALAPRYKLLAEYLEMRYPGEFELGTIDGTKNEVDHGGQGFLDLPTVWLYPKGKKSPPYPVDLSRESGDIHLLLKAVRLICSKPRVQREKEAEYVSAAARFKAAVRALKHTMGPAAKELNEAAERLEKLAVDRSEL